jgi:ribosomal protein S27AE
MSDNLQKIFFCRRCRKQFTAQRYVLTIYDGEIKQIEVKSIGCPKCGLMASNHCENKKRLEKLSK